jgi:hypothetical protein
MYLFIHGLIHLSSTHPHRGHFSNMKFTIFFNDRRQKIQNYYTLEGNLCIFGVLNPIVLGRSQSGQRPGPVRRLMPRSQASVTTHQRTSELDRKTFRPGFVCGRARHGRCFQPSEEAEDEGVEADARMSATYSDRAGREEPEAGVAHQPVVTASYFSRKLYYISCTYCVIIRLIASERMCQPCSCLVQFTSKDSTFLNLSFSTRSSRSFVA